MRNFEIAPCVCKMRRLINRAQYWYWYAMFSYAVPPKINVTTSTASNPQVVVGRSKVIRCDVSGVPQPETQWINNGRPIDRSDPRFRIGAEGRQLEIIDSEVSDTGRYTCIAKNDAGIVDRDFDLEVLGMLCVRYHAARRSRPSALCLVHTAYKTVFSCLCRRCELNWRQVKQKISKLNMFIFCRFVPSPNAGLDKTVQPQIYRGLLKTVLTCRRFSSHRRHGRDKCVSAV